MWIEIIQNSRSAENIDLNRLIEHFQYRVKIDDFHD